MPRWPRQSPFPAALAAALLLLGGCASDGNQTFHKSSQEAQQTFVRTRSTMRLQQAQRQFDAGDLDQAEKTATDALADDPKFAGLMVITARIKIERGELEQAKLLLAQAVALDPKLPEAHYYAGLVQQRWQQYAAARDQYHQAYDLAKDHAPYLLAEAEMLVDLDRADQAVALLTDKLTYFDQNSALRMALAHIYEIQHQYDRAAEFYHQVALLRPDDGEVTVSLARVQLEGGGAPAAVATLEPLCALPKYLTRSDAQRLLARAYVGAGRLRDARAQYVRVMKLTPNDAEVWVRLGEVCLKLADQAGALEAARRATELAPQTQDGPLLAGMVYRAMGQVGAAQRCFTRAAELAPQAAAPLILLGITYEQQGHLAAAAGAYTQALQREPGDLRARQLLAHLGAGT
jgi:tetratricopeptide (TPR) repeat protein